LSSQDAVAAKFDDAKESSGQPRPNNAATIIGGVLGGLAFIGILLFTGYLTWRRKRRAADDSFSPMPWQYARAPQGSVRESRMGIVPVLRSGELMSTAMSLDADPSVQYHRPNGVTKDH
jgi:hypothetical protein